MFGRFIRFIEFKESSVPFRKNSIESVLCIKDNYKSFYLLLILQHFTVLKSYLSRLRMMEVNLLCTLKHLHFYRCYWSQALLWIPWKLNHLQQMSVEPLHKMAVNIKRSECHFEVNLYVDYFAIQSELLLVPNLLVLARGYRLRYSFFWN